jgi:DNA repair ATPase RecN
MKLHELKAQVFELAKVETTQQLKANYAALRSLDMRRKASWEKALSILEPTDPEFQAWLENPPEEYREAFAEIDAIAKQFDQSLHQARQLGQEVVAIAADLEESAADLETEAEQLQQEIEIGRRVAKQAEQN